MKIQIEINRVDGRTYLNFWDSGTGQDLIAELVDGQLYLHLGEEDYDPIDVEDFINRAIKLAEREQ